ncbi:sigma-70 family RNA polymerase sigma factor [archaeon]|nr:sigma-70 family RNA polymerase sigma factor [archaeon]
MSSVLAGYKKAVVGPLTEEEVNGLLRVVKENETVGENQVQYAVKRLTCSVIPLVISFAKRYINDGVSFDDLLQEGFIGVQRAIYKFEFVKGTKFSTYAVSWIKQAMRRAAQRQASIIRMPLHKMDLLNKIKKVSREMQQKLNRQPTLPEIAAGTEKEEQEIQAALAQAEYTVAISLYRPLELGLSEELMLGDCIKDMKSPNQENLFEKDDLAFIISQALTTLDPDEEEVIRYRFGIGVSRCYFLSEVAEMFGITKEGVRSIELKAIKKLKGPSRAKKLKPFLGHLVSP